jgi:hypothetical protein
VQTNIFNNLFGFSTQFFSLPLQFGLFFVPVKTPEAGAQTSLYCCLEELIANDSGKYYSDCREKTPSARARNAEDAKKLWAISEKLTNLNQE